MQDKKDDSASLLRVDPSAEVTADALPNYGPESDTWEDRGFTPPVCRCGHGRDDHGSSYEQRDGQKVYVQKCEHCQCEVFTDRDGQLSKLIDSCQPMRGFRCER
jgi:hypothetical protein